MITRGDIWTADLDPVRGTEANKVRPVIVVSNDARNRIATQRGEGMVTVVPVTSNVEWLYDFQILVPPGEATGLATASKAQAEQVRSLDVRRLVAKIGGLDAERSAALDYALALHLGLPT